MIFAQQWTGYRIENGIRDEGFFARVPGNIQYDYAVSHDFADIMYNDGCRQFEALENDTWEYRTRLQFDRKDGERVFLDHGTLTVACVTSASFSSRTASITNTIFCSTARRFSRARAYLLA